MKIKLLIFLTIFSINLAISQDTNLTHPLVAYSSEDGWHFLDNTGKELFHPKKLTDVSGFSEGFFCVKGVINGKEQWAYMDLNGEIKITPGTDEITLFSEGRAAVFNYTKIETDEKLVGFINKEGDFVVPIKYLDAISFSEGLAYVMNERDRGYIDTNGNIVLRLKDKVGYRFTEGIAALSTNDFKVGYIDHSGKLILPYQYDEPSPFKSGLATIMDRGKFGCINKKGEFIIPSLYDEVKLFNEERSFVAKNNTDHIQYWALIDITGHLLTEYIFKQVREYSNGLACIMIQDKWGYIDRNGNFAFPNNFTFAESFTNDNLAWGSRADKKIAGFIGKDGEFKIKIPSNAKKVVDLRLNKQLYY